MNKLILSEKPSTAKILAHVVGAREKIYSNSGKAYCYSGNGFYVVNARGHLYGLGEPEDYGYSKTYNIDELPMFPGFRIFPCGKDTEELRRLISELMARDDVDEIICATDAGREGELIFRHIYEANRCTKPVKRLWCNSMTDEAIREQLKNLPPDSDFDGEYYAALARQKCDWIIGMNLSRLYGVLDNYPHHIGRVKTPVLSIIVQRDNEIQNFQKSVSYRLEMPNGALSETVFNSREEAERQGNILNGREVSVTSTVNENRSKNRPLLHNLTSLQQEANNLYGYTAKETLDTAQSLYEKKLITYPRTDCNYISEDMKNGVIRLVDRISSVPEYAERAEKLITQGLNLDERVVNNRRMDGHDHHAIIPESVSGKADELSEIERNVYSLVVNRLLCALDKPYIYRETNYEFKCNDIIFKLKAEMKAVSREGEEYEADYVLEDTGKYINLKRPPYEKKIIGTCPKCGKSIYEGRNNFYCESGKNGCGFTLWKEDKYNGITITAANASDLLSGKKIYKSRKTLDGETEKKAYSMVINGKYVNIRAAEDK